MEALMIKDKEIRIGLGKFVGWRLQTPDVDVDHCGIMADFFHKQALIDFLQMAGCKFRFFLLIWTEKNTLEAQPVCPTDFLSYVLLSPAISDGEEWFCEKTA